MSAYSPFGSRGWCATGMGAGWVDKPSRSAAQPSRTAEAATTENSRAGLKWAESHGCLGFFICIKLWELWLILAADQPIHLRATEQADDC